MTALPHDTRAWDPPRWVRIAVVALSLAAVAAFAGVALARIGHPYELEWMAGAFLDHVCRILDGNLIYAAPDPEHVPFLYAPLYFYVSAGVSLATGEGFLPLRLVSLASAAATLAVAGWWIARRTGSRTAGWATAGLYAGCYFVVDTWYDTARADSLFVLLSLVALVVLDRGERRGSAIAAAAVLVLAFLAKQTALLLAPPFAVAAAFASPRRAAWFAGSFVALWGLAFGALDLLHDGWFSFYTWTLPRRHEYDWGLLPGFFWQDLRPLWPLCLIAIWLAVARARQGRYRELLSDGAWSLGLVAAALSSRMHVGGAINVLMPALLGLSLIGGVAWREASRARDAPRAGRPAPRIVPIAIALQLGALWLDFGNQDEPGELPRPVDPRRYVPTAADRAVGDRLVQILRDADGDVLVPLHGYLPRRAGKRPGAHTMAVLDVVRTRTPEVGTELERRFWDEPRQRDAAIVVLDDNLTEFVGVPRPMRILVAVATTLRAVAPPGLGVPVVVRERGFDLLTLGFTEVEDLVPSGDAFEPVVGLRARPRFVFRRRR